MEQLKNSFKIKFENQQIQDSFKIDLLKIVSKSNNDKEVETELSTKSTLKPNLNDHLFKTKKMNKDMKVNLLHTFQANQE